MKTLLLYPQFPQSFWSYDRAMEMAGLKAAIPPLGIITVAALLREDWEIRFYDRNVSLETDADWEWWTWLFSLLCWCRNRISTP